MGATPNRTILVADPSAFWRNLMRSALNMAGYTVLEASSFEEVQQNLDGQAVALIVAALDLPHNGSAGLIPLLRSRPEWSRIPVLAVAESPDHARSFDFRGAGFQDCQPKFDTVAELESIARLMSPSFLPNLHFEHVGEVR